MVRLWTVDCIALQGTLVETEEIIVLGAGEGGRGAVRDPPPPSSHSVRPPTPPSAPLEKGEMER